MMGERAIRLGCAGGYLEGRLAPGLALAREGECQYLALEALNEASLSVLQRELERDPSAGFHRRGIASLSSLAVAADSSTKLVSSVGGANPRAAAVELARQLDALGLSRRVAYVEGDNLTSRLVALARSGALVRTDGAPLTGEDLSAAFAASAYLGAFPIAAALGSGADVVITGRVVDSALYLGPALHEFGWTTGDLTELAIGSVAGHLLECAGHLLGGNYWGPDWDSVDYANLGHGIAELTSNAGLTVTKLPSAAGMITRHTVAQQLLYEIGDPAAYVLPDVTVDISRAAVTEIGADRVVVEGVVGRDAPSTLKVVVSKRAGFIADGLATFTWPDAATKAHRAADALSRRLKDVHGITDYRIDLLGAGALVAPPDEITMAHLPEVTLRVAAAATSEEQARLVHEELANFYDCSPAGACGIAGPTSGSRSGVRERVQILPCSLDAAAIELQTEFV